MCGIFNKHYYREARKADPVRFQSTTSFTITSAGAQTISDLESLDGNGCGVFIDDASGAITDTQLQRTNRGSQSTGYWWDSKNSQIVFTGSPNDKYWVVYFPTVAKPTTSTTSLLLDENDDEAVIDYFRRLIDLWDDRTSRVNLSDALLQNSMRRLLDNLNPDTSGGLATNYSYF
jgi:hypothetical protein